MKVAKGITSEFFPEDWEEGRAKIHREFKIYKGVTIATRSVPIRDRVPVTSEASIDTQSTSLNELTARTDESKTEQEFEVNDVPTERNDEIDVNV